MDRDKIIKAFDTCCNVIPCDDCDWDACHTLKMPPPRMHIPLDLCLAVLALLKEQEAVPIKQELVRCKDCKKRKTEECMMYWNGILDDETWNDDWYCADGAKKDD